jgi:hypothetical protein
MRRCTVINEGISGQLLSSRWAPSTTKTIQGCILSKPSVTNSTVMIDVNNTPPGGSISALAYVGTTATVTFLYGHGGFTVGDKITVTGATDAYFNVTSGTITGVPDAYSVTYTMAGTPTSTTFSSATGSAVGGSTINNFKYNLYYTPGRTDAVIRNNVAYGTPTSAVSQTDISSGAFDTTYASAGMVGNAIGQATYENSALYNYRLAASDTLAFNKYLTNNGISTDADGLNGTVYTYQDIGAFERQ